MPPRARQVELHSEQELCLEIMKAALRHCEKLGFTVKVGHNHNNFIVSEKTLRFYHPDKNS